MDIPSISDDVLQCIIYLLKDDETAVLVTQIMTFVEKMIPDHIWHRDSFELTLSKESKGAIECTMRVGDSIDDEWLVVYLLWQVTKQFSVAARYYFVHVSFNSLISYSVCDADGQFLLIEAADKLPAWVTPENVENRVSGIGFEENLFILCDYRSGSIKDTFILYHYHPNPDQTPGANAGAA